MDIEIPEHAIDDEIYVMPQFVTLEVSDLERSRRWYRDAVGFHELSVLPGPDGAPLLVHLRRYRYQDILLVPATGPVTASTSATLSLAYTGGHDELGDLADRARALPDGTAYGPVETPWFATEVRLTDPDGNRITLTARSRREVPADWDATVRASVDTVERA